MRKIKKELIMSAWTAVSKKTYNKFWGVLSILSSIKSDRNVKPGRTYSIDTANLAETLDRIFLFGSPGKDHGTSALFVTFSKVWAKRASEILCKEKISIAEAALFFYLDRDFDQDYDLYRLVNDFKRDIRLDDEEINNLFDVDFRNIQDILEQDYPKSVLYANIQKLAGQEFKNETLSVEGQFNIDARPSEFSRAPFIQTLYAGKEISQCLFLTSFDLNEFYNLSSTKTPATNKELANVIYYGPPGTGKTYAINRDYISGLGNDKMSLVTFHQAYSYEEFVEGIKPVISTCAKEDADDKIVYEYSDGTFYKACDQASRLAGYKDLAECLADTENNRSKRFEQAINKGDIFNFCIDEINRANVAGVFGDLISLIETNKRLGNSEELIVSLPYSKRRFGVPANLRVIGTMNTADRSITLIDTALRRRFVFLEVAPNYELIEEQVKLEDIDVSKMLKTINDRIKYFLTKDNCVGHACFLGVKTKSDLLKVFVNKVIPLLEEYFYNDYAKIKLVLGEGGVSNDNCFFIEDTESVSSVLFKTGGEEIEDKIVYKPNLDLFTFLFDDENRIVKEVFTKIYE